MEKFVLIDPLIENWQDCRAERATRLLLAAQSLGYESVLVTSKTMKGSPLPDMKFFPLLSITSTSTKSSAISRWFKKQCLAIKLLLINRIVFANGRIFTASHYQQLTAQLDRLRGRRGRQLFSIISWPWRLFRTLSQRVSREKLDQAFFTKLREMCQRIDLQSGDTVYLSALEPAAEAVWLRFLQENALLAPQASWHLGSRQTLCMPLLCDTEQHDVTHVAPLTVSYLGDAEAEQGYSALPSLIQDVWLDGVASKQIRFVVSSSSTTQPIDATVVVAKAQLQHFPEDAVSLIHEPLTAAQYAALLRKSDIVVIPGQANTVRHREVVTDALAAGIPVIVAAGSWAADVLAPAIVAYQRSLRHPAVLPASAIGVIFTEREEMRGALQEIMQHYAHYQATARQFAVTWRQRQTPEHIFSLLRGNRPATHHHVATAEAAEASV